MDYKTRIANENIKWRDKLKDMTEYFAIYQLKTDDKYRDYHFLSTKFLKNYDLEIQKEESYNLLYASSLMKLVQTINFNSIPDMLEYLFGKFNIDRPSDFLGHSLSVSDVIVVCDGIEKKSYYVDDFGFTELMNWEGKNPVTVQKN